MSEEQAQSRKMLAIASKSLGLNSPIDASSPWWYIEVSWQSALVAITCFLLIAVSFEIERAITIYEFGRSAAEAVIWEPALLRSLWLSLLWGVGGLCYRRERR